MKTLLLELLSEEMPAQAQRMAAYYIAEYIKEKAFTIAALKIEPRYYYTPRRLTVICNNLPDEVIIKTDEIKGPRVDASKEAVDGFMRKNSLTTENELENRNGIYFISSKQINVNISKLIADIVLNALSSVPWAKSMRWGQGCQIKWTRPLQSILCMLDDEVISFDFGHITSSNITHGHRFLASDEICIKHANDYEEAMHKAYVMLDQDKRKAAIIEAIQRMANSLGLRLMKDEAMVEEVVCLVEWPVVMLCEIPKHFMQLPPELLIINLRHHQKYLMLENAEGKLSGHFVIVANNITKDNGETIMLGNLKVLNARLEDAKFFYEQDLSTQLENRVNKLKSLIFHKDIGSIYEKMKKTSDIALNILNLCDINNINLDEVNNACMLAKADLTTSSVGEFPELQGVIGYYCALHNHFGENIALSIKEHYKPMGPSDTPPSTLFSAIVALADKLATLSLMFSADIKPTGSKDPYALRRAAIGALRIIITYNLDFALADLKLQKDVCAFIADKLKGLVDQGVDVNTLMSNRFNIVAALRVSLNEL